MKIKLDVMERLVLGNILPESGNRLSLRVVMDLRRKIEFDAKEQEELEMTVDGTSIGWKKDKENPDGYEYEMELKELEMIRGSLKKLDDNEKLEPKHLTLWDKFMEVI